MIIVQSAVNGGIMAEIRNIAIIGFGEVGGILGRDLSEAGTQVAIYDILLEQPGARPAMLAKADEAHVRAAGSLADALAGADLVISAVTAASALEAAQQAAASLVPGQFYLDLNSVSPQSKREIALHVAASGAKFVEAAVMAPILPQRLKTPVLLAGPAAREAADLLSTLRMNVQIAGEKVGAASAQKMCRSVLVKGLEALAVECLFAARRYGVENEVLASLDASYPSMGWGDHLPEYLVSRVAQHGWRRAAEMREACVALEQVGVEPLMSRSIAERQEWLVHQMQERAIAFKAEVFSWRALADSLDGSRLERDDMGGNGRAIPRLEADSEKVIGWKIRISDARDEAPTASEDNSLSR